MPAKQQIGRQSSQKGKPVGRYPIGQRCQERVARANTRENEHPTQTRLDDTETSGSDGQEADDAGDCIGKKNQRRAGMTTSGPQDSQQTAEVGTEPGGTEQNCLLPLSAQCRAYGIPVAQQPFAQPRQRQPVPSDPIP